MPARERLIALDAVRGLAIVLMLVAHGVEWLGNPGPNRPIAGFLAGIGDTLCYTTFVLVMGVAAYLAYLRRPALDRATRRRMLRRNARVLYVYYGAALVLAATHGGDRWLGWHRFAYELASILSLRTLIQFSEFLLPLGIYGLSLVALWPLYHWLATHPRRLALVAAAAYMAGTLGYQRFIRGGPVPWLSLLVGGGYSFALLQYLPVLLLGLSVGRVLTRRAAAGRHWWPPLVWGGAVAMGAALLLPWGPQVGIDPSLDQRWPPSPAFLCLGIGFALLALGCCDAVHAGVADAVQDYLAWIGRRPLAILLAHYVVLVLVNRILHVGNFELGGVIIGTAGVIALSLALSRAADILSGRGRQGSRSRECPVDGIAGRV